MYRKKQIFEVRAYKFKELAAIYKVNPKTFRRWIRLFEKEIGVLDGDYYMIPQVEKIIEKIGLPYQIEIDEDFNDGKRET
jgi:transposase-like protein